MSLTNSQSDNSDSDLESNNNNNNKNNKNNKNVIKVHSRKRKLSNSNDGKPNGKRTKHSKHKHKHKNKDSNKRKHRQTSSNSSHTTSNNSTNSSEKSTPSNKKKLNESCIPSVLIPNLYLNYKRYQKKSEIAKKRKILSNNNNKKYKVSLGVDMRTYTSEIAAVTQIINICKGTDLSYTKRGTKQNFETDLKLKDFVVLYIEIYGYDLLLSLFEEGTEGLLFEDFYRKLEAKHYPSHIAKFVRKTMKGLVEKGIRKYSISKFVGQIKNNYSPIYFPEQQNQNEEKNESEETENEEINMFWTNYVSKERFDELNGELLAEANKQLHDEEEDDEESDFIDLSLSNSPQPIQPNVM